MPEGEINVIGIKISIKSIPELLLSPAVLLIKLRKYEIMEVCRE